MSAFSFAPEAPATAAGSSSRRMPRLPNSSRNSGSNRGEAAQPSLLPLPRATQPSLNPASATAPPASNNGLADWNPFASPPRASNTGRRQSGGIAGGHNGSNTGGTSWGAFGFSQETSGSNRSQNWPPASSYPYNGGFSFAPRHQSTPPLMGLTGGTPSRRSPERRSQQRATLIEEPQRAEWSLFGVSCIWDDLAKKNADMQTEHNNQFGLVDLSATSPGRRPSTSMSTSKDPFDCFSAPFGGERWHLGIIHPTASSDSESTTSRPDDLRCFLSCGILELDFPNRDVEIPASLHISLTPLQVQGSSRPEPVWEVWSDFIFASESEYFQCPFPSITNLFERSSLIREADAVVIQVQVQSPMEPAFATGQVGNLLCGPRIKDTVLLPDSMLEGFGALLDDPNTADVRLYVYERSPVVRIPGLATQQPLYRKRVLLAHSSVLKARSTLFKDMLDAQQQWSEAAVQVEEQPSGRMRRLSHVAVNVEFNSLYWLLSWLYKDSSAASMSSICTDYRINAEVISPSFTVVFADVDHTQFPEELSEGLIEASDAVTPGHIGWDWQPLSAPDDLQTPPLATPRDPHEGGRQSLSGGLGRISPVQRSSSGKSNSPAKSAPTSPSQSSYPLSLTVSPHTAKTAKDPHEHPCAAPPAASAFAVYAVAHFVGLGGLCRIAQQHLVAKLTPSSAFPLLMATHLFEDLHAAVMSYTLAHWEEVRSTSSYDRTMAEVSEGYWCGNDTLLRLTKLLSPNPNASVSTSHTQTAFD